VRRHYTAVTVYNGASRPTIDRKIISAEARQANLAPELKPDCNNDVTTPTEIDSLYEHSTTEDDYDSRSEWTAYEDGIPGGARAEHDARRPSKRQKTTTARVRQLHSGSMIS
jgi:hypothetical protein